MAHKGPRRGERAATNKRNKDKAKTKSKSRTNKSK
jgi:hypothetical protein